MTFDTENEILYVAQSKWIEDGQGTIGPADSKEFLRGSKDLASLRLDRFNDCVRQALRIN